MVAGGARLVAAVVALMPAPVVYTIAQQRRDVALVRRALTEALAGPDRRAAADAYERLLRKWARTEDDTQEVPTP